MVTMLAWLIATPLLGALTGLRTMIPMAALCWFAYLGHLPVAGTWAFWIAKPISAIVFTVLALGELIGDKLPNTPNRTAPFPLIGRVAFGGLVGALALTGLHGSVIEGAVLGSISALAGTFVGFSVRRMLVQEKGFSDPGVALAEDAITIGLSVLALGFITA